MDTSTALFGKPTVEMLLQAHEDALWILENLGVGCCQPEMLAAIQPYESQGLAIVHENRVYITRDLVAKCLSTVPGVADFLCP
jgi:trimethylamine:corrinoid methyltransferase-like protein